MIGSVASYRSVHPCSLVNVARTAESLRWCSFPPLRCQVSARSAHRRWRLPSIGWFSYQHWLTMFSYGWECLIIISIGWLYSNYDSLVHWNPSYKIRFLEHLSAWRVPVKHTVPTIPSLGLHMLPCQCQASSLVMLPIKLASCTRRNVVRRIVSRQPLGILIS